MATPQEEQLKRQLAEALSKAKKAAQKKKRNEEWKPSFDGQHRGF